MEPDQIDDLNSGFVQELLADYLASPESVDPEWRKLFESNPELVLASLPDGVRLRELRADGDGNGAAPPAAPAPAEAPPADDLIVGGVAAAMSLVKVIARTVTSPRTSTRWAPSRPGIPPSTPTASSRG